MFRVPLPPEPFPDVIFEPCQRNVQLENVTEEAFLVGKYAYFVFDKQIVLACEKGKIYFGRIYDIFANRFLDDSLVVIKKLRKPVRPKEENPENEVSAARLIGDDRHCLRVIEALQDERYLYIVTPYLGSDLLQNMYAHGASSSSDAQLPLQTKQIVHQLTRSLLHVKRHNLIHRDVSPENFILTSDSNCPLIDFAMSLRIPTLESNPQWVAPQSVSCGKLPYMSPEVVMGQPLDSGVDLWALGQILTLLWTHGERLYQITGDRSWKFWIRDKGLLLQDLDAVMEQFLSHTDKLPDEYIVLQRQIPMIQSLLPEQRVLLSRIFEIDANKRISIEEVIQCLEHMQL